MRPQDSNTSSTIGTASESELRYLLDAYNARPTWIRVHARCIAEGRDGEARVAEDMLADLPEVGALDALEATTRLIKLMTGSRWIVMRDARESGASWGEVGTAIGMTGAEARTWYAEAIARQAKYVSTHDTARAEAVL